MSANELHVMDNADRDFLQEHFVAIAQYLLKKRIWRQKWIVDVEGCAFKFNMSGYAKQGTPIWEEQQKQLRAVEAEMGPLER